MNLETEINERGSDGVMPRQASLFLHPSLPAMKVHTTADYS